MAITKLDVKMIQATGTPSNNTWLRGDGSWQTITISPAPVWATAQGSIAIANEQAVFSANLLAVDRNDLTISYAVISGSLPSGLSLNASTGAITGTTPQVNTNTTYTFTINANNGAQTTARTFSITVNNSTNEPPTWSTAAGSLGSVNANASFNYSLSATDPNSDPITYSIVSGSLPAGLSMSTLGVITGTVSSGGSTSNFTVRANDGLGGTVDRAFSITVVVPFIQQYWAGSSTGQIAYSSTGIDSWTIVSSPLTSAIVDIAAIPGVLVARAYDGSTAYSNDGTNWVAGPTYSTSSSCSSPTLISGNGVFVMNPVYGNFVRVSTDGVNWTTYPTTNSDGYYACLQFANGKLFEGSEKQTYVSDNGQTWAYIFGGYTASLMAVAYGNGKWFAQAVYGQAWTSTDSVNWTTTTGVGTEWWNWSGVANSLVQMTYFNNRWIMSGMYTGWSQDDGATWNNKTYMTTIIGSPTGRIATGPDKVVVSSSYYGPGYSTALYNTHMAYTTDGVSWTQINGPFGSNYTTCIYKR